MESRNGQLQGKLALVVVMAMALGTATTNSSARAAIDFTVIDSQLRTLEFGKGFEAIADWIGKRLDRIYLPRIAQASDANERARVRARRDQEIAEMKANEVIFDGRRTGFEGSVIASEYGVGTNESMYTYKEGAATHFFLMHEGKLWKYARVMGTDARFEARLSSFQVGLGSPTSTREEPTRKGKSVVLATWEKGDYDVRLADRRTVFGVDLLIIEDRAVAKRLEELRGRAHRGGLGGVSESLESFLLEDADNYGKPDNNK